MGRTRGAPHPRPNRGSIAERTLDLLLIDGGWLTCPGMALALDVNERTLRRVLYRICTKGLLEERTVGLGVGDRNHIETRREWRHPQANEMFV